MKKIPVNKTTVTHLVSENRKSYRIEVTTKDDKFIIPVIDVRDGNIERGMVSSILKQHNIRSGSNFLRPSFAGWGGCYQNSHKSSL